MRLAALLPLLILLVVPAPAIASILDSIPVVSQVKSLVQVIGGDAEGAKETQENFVDTVPVISDLKRVVQDATGDHDGVKKSFEKYRENAEGFVDSIPVIGHIKGGIQMSLGDTEGGLNAIKSASSSTGAVIGGILGGPGGAIVGAALTDSLITGFDSAINKEDRKFGLVDYVANIGKKDSGEHIDQALGFGLDILGGTKGKSKTKLKGKPDAGNPKPDVGNPKPDVANPKPDADTHLGSSEPHTVTDKSETATIASSMRDKSRLNKLIGQIKDIGENIAAKLDDKTKLNALRQKVEHLPVEHQMRLELYDFRDVNSFRGEFNCYLCTLAGASKKMIGKLSKIYEEKVGIAKKENAKVATDRLTPPKVVEKLFRDTEFPHADLTHFENFNDFKAGIKTRLQLFTPDTVYKFGFAYIYEAGGGHIVVGRAWLDYYGKVQTLFTDFQVDPANFKQRYFSDMPPGTKSPMLFDLGTNEYTITNVMVKKPKPPVFDGCTISGCGSIGASHSQLAHLDEGARSRVKPMNLLKVKDVNLSGRCHWCVPAMLYGVAVSNITSTTNLNIPDLERGPRSLEELIGVLRLWGYPDTNSVSGSKQQIAAYLNEKLKPERSTNVVLAYKEGDSLESVVLDAWKTAGNQLGLLITDYSFDPMDSRRFKRSLDEIQMGNAQLHLVVPVQINQVDSDSLAEDSQQVDEETLKSGASCSSKRIVGYVASWSRNPISVARAARFTNLVIAFAAMGSDLNLKMPSDSISQQRLIDVFTARKALNARGVRLQLSVAIGGWSNSQHFSWMAREPEWRKLFVANVVKLIADWKLNGVDIDWEYPGTGGETTGKPEDRANYVTLLQELRQALGPRVLLSIAAGAGEESMRGFDVQKIVGLVDWIGVMSYDFNGAWDSKWGAYVGPNAPLWHAAPPNYSGKLNANWAAKQYVCKSQTPSKILLGLPFYGRFWSKTVAGIDPVNYPLFRMAERHDGNKFGGEVSYRDLEERWLESSSLHFDEKSKTPWAANRANSSILTYDDRESIAHKVKYALDHNLGGVMVWSIDQDDAELTLTRELAAICKPTTNNSISYKCNPIQDERRWWIWAESETNGGMCGRNAPLYKGFYAHCDPDDVGFACCGEFGYCGSGPKYCDCPKCVDYAKDPQQLVKEPVKPSRPIQWHVGFDQVKPGSPRCGPSAPPIGEHVAICNPDDDNNHCCSASGFCGSGAEFCDCKGCKNYRKLSLNDSMVRARKPEEIFWHLGFDKVKPGEPRCGHDAPPVNGFVATCDPDDENHCCSPAGYCGSGPNFCSCAGCKDYSKIPASQAKVKVSAPGEITWHQGFGVIKHGQPRCGANVARVNGKVATCNPNSDAPCCSEYGYCGSGPGFCK